MDTRDSSKRDTTKFHSKGVVIPSKHAKEIISHKKKRKRNKKTWKPKSVEEEDDNLLQPQRLVTSLEFLPRSFLDDHQKKVLEVTACHVVSIVEVDNNYAFE